MKTNRTFLAILVMLPLSLFAHRAHAEEAASPAAPEKWERRSTPLVVSGATGIALGVPTTLIGGLLTALCVGPWGGNLDPKTAGVQGHCYPMLGATGTGLGLIGGGIAGIIYGSKRVPVEAETSSLVPVVNVGPRSGSLTWHF